MSKALIWVLLFAALHCPAQKQGDIWYFGVKAGIDFSSGVPIVLSNGQTGTDIGAGVQEGTSAVSDSSGAILFYTGGKTIWNRNHLPMPNGTGLMGGISSTQSNIIVPLPGSNSVFYVFTSDDFQGYGSSSQKGYRYSVVNMCLDSGNGDVVSGQKNILLSDSSTEKLAVCKDISGTGYWIVGHKMFSDEFYAWLLTSAGITDTVISNIGTVHGWNNVLANWVTGAAQGQMKFNPSGTKLALVIGNFDPAYLDLFDFDSSTGLLSNPCHIVIDSILQKSIYGIEFSPNGSKLYTGTYGGSGGKRLYQFEVKAGGGACDSIKASRIQLFQSSVDPAIIYGMQLATDGKIYLVCNSYNDLGRINYPDLTGLAAGFDSLAVSITEINQYTLPTFVAGFRYHNGIPPCADPNGIAEHIPAVDVLLFPNPNNGIFSVTLKDYAAYSLDIFNMLGERIYSATASNYQNAFEIDISAQPAGFYIVQMRTVVGVFNRKVAVIK